MKSVYSRLKDLLNDPNFKETRDNELYIRYQELLMELTPTQKYYWKNQEQLTLHYRQNYSKKVDKPTRQYNKTNSDIPVKRSDYPAGPEGDILYKKAYQKEWWRLNHPPKSSDPSYCRKYNKQEAWNNRQASRVAAAEKKQKDKLIVKSMFQWYYDKGCRSMWTVQGGAESELHRIEYTHDTLDNKLDYIPKYTLSTFYEALKPAAGYAEDGEIRALLKGNRWNIKEDLYNRLCTLFKETYHIVSDSCVMIEVYKSGEPLGEGVRDEIALLRNRRQELRLKLSSLLKEMKKESRRLLEESKDVTHLTIDQQQFLLQPAMIVYCLRSGIVAANYFERKEMYLYYKLHKYSVYKRAQKQGTIDAERNRQEQFNRLDKQLSESGMTSEEYWTRSNEHGITKVDIKGQEKVTSIDELKEEHLNRRNLLSKEQKLERSRHKTGV
jgi:hypothetical protein